METPAATSSYLDVARRTALITAIVLMFVAAAAAFVLAPQIFFLIFLGAMLGVFLYRLSVALGRFLPIAYGYRLSLLVGVVLVLAGTFFYFFGAGLASQIQKAARQFDEAVAQLSALAEEYPGVQQAIDASNLASTVLSTGQSNEATPADGQNQANQDQTNQEPQSREDERPEEKDKQSSDDDPSKETSRLLSSLGTQLITAIKQLFITASGVLVNILLVSFLGLYFAASYQLYHRCLLVLFAPERRPQVDRVARQIGETVWRWSLGRLFSMMIVGIGTSVILYVLEVPLALFLGVLAGMLAFVPNVGPVLAMIMIALFALPQGGTTVLWVIAGLSLLELLESWIVTPLVDEHQVSVPPAFVLTAQAIFGVIFGFYGLMIASPLMAVIRVLFRRGYREGVLGESLQE